MFRGAVVLALVILPGVAPAAPQDVPEVTAAQFATALRYGESVNGFPNWAERVIHEWMNRARVDPQIDLAQCGAACPDKTCYTALPPLSWNEQANRAARFHGAEIAKQQYFAHDSQCTVVPNIDALYPAGCDGSASCACVGGTRSCAPNGCTSMVGRVALFGASLFGEIIAGSVDPNGAFYLWLNEPSSGNLCGYSGQNGHRWLILTSLGAVGVGVAPLGAAVGDFTGGSTPYKIPSGSHYPQQAASVDLWANWFDSAGPRSAHAVVDGQCVTLTLRRGTPANGAWTAATAGVGTGCHRYYFTFVDAGGTGVTYPTTGSLGIGSGSGCADWDATRLQASCATSTPPAPSRRRSARH